MIATGGTDGRIVIWNMDQSSIKQVLFEPLMRFKAQDEISIESIMFLYTSEDHTLQNAQLISTHADGYIRIWDVPGGVMEQEIDLENVESEAMICMVTSQDSKWIMVGGSRGTVRILPIKKCNRARKSFGAVHSFWFAHTRPITTYMRQ